MKRHNVGILGFGFIGKAHAYGYTNLPLFYDPVPLQHRLHSVCTSRPETAEKARALLGFERACTDYREITENPEIDIVHICTPNKFHKDALLSAMAHGKHVYCEKPLCTDLAEAEEIETALVSYTGIAQMVFNYRFFPATIRAQELAAEGFLGRVLSLRAVYLHSGSVNPDAPLKWKLDRQMGGGIIGDLGSHVLDIVNMLVGDFEALWCATHIAYADRPAADGSGRRVPVEAPDSALMAVRLPGGCVGSIEASKIATGAQDELRFEVHGERGALRFNLMHSNWLEAYDATRPGGPTGGWLGWQAIDTVQNFPPPASGFPTGKSGIGWLRGHAACLHNFLSAVARGEPAEPGLRQGLYIQRLMAAAEDSAQSGQWVDVSRVR
ncbi:MAG: Gfo/Idh/MocA family protein [Armatimonadota bacterium]